MGFYNSPRIILDDLVLNLDAGNTKSYAGDVPTPVGTDYGYMGGGHRGWPNFTTVVQRIDYNNDTATAVTKGPLSDARYAFGAAGNLSYGYFAGGYSPASGGTRWSRIDRIDYSSDTGTAAVKGNMTEGKNSLAGTGNVNYGYFAGGATNSYAAFSTVERVDYSNDSATASPKGPLSVKKGSNGAAGNQSYGYFIGGSDNTPGYPEQSSIDRLDYSNDSSTGTPKGNITKALIRITCVDNASYGWVTGGHVQTPDSRYSIVNRIDYSNDTATASPKGPLSEILTYHAGTGNSSYGYLGGGRGNSGDWSGKSKVERIDYSNDTPTAATKGPLGAVVVGAVGVSPRDNGMPTTSGTQTRSVTQTVGTPYGYWAGGLPGPVSTMNRLDYDSDTTTAVTKGPLSAARYAHKGTGNISYGYFGGKYPASNICDRFDYSNDTTAATPKGNIGTPGSGRVAVGNNDYGYFCGGSYPAKSTVNRIDYSNDTASAAAKGPLSAVTYQAAATGNSSYGWIGGGSPPSISSVDRIDYSNDTATASPKGPLSFAGGNRRATGNASYGYFGGGDAKSTVDRVDYSSDTPAATTKGPLDTGRNRSAATGDTSYGYFGGGSPSSSSIGRVDYSSDTDTATTKGPLTAGKYNMAAVSPRANALPGPYAIYPWYDTSGKGDDGDNSSGGASYGSGGGGSFTFNGSSNYVSSDDKANLQLGSGNFTLAAWIKPANPVPTPYGYFGGGRYPSAGNYSIVDRVDYDNDTATASARGNLSGAQKGLGATGNTSYGYFGGGASPKMSTVNRVDYADDTATAVVKGPLSYSDEGISATGNASYGYFMGGPSLTTVSRIDYADDTSTALTKGPLAAAKWYGAATGNSSYGYIAGNTPGSSLMDRLDYSSDTSTAAAKGPLSAARYGMGAAGNASYGYFGGGRSGPSRYTTVDRLDYSSDSTTCVVKGPLTSARQYLAATGDTSYGYIAGGFTSSSYLISTIDRVDYSNDTATAVTKGPLSTGRAVTAGASPKANALSGRSDNEGIISYSDTAGEQNDTTCQLDTNSDGKIKFSGAAGIVTSTSAVAADTWAHAAVTRTDNTISVYVNGVLENTGITTHTFSDYAKVTIGANRPRSTFYKGDISQVQIYKKALSSDDIQQNFRSLKKRFGL